jgi:hypothetical protein
MNTALTGAAGEHYVAYKLSLLGYCVGLSRGGSPFVDIMLSNRDGEGVAIQVKTSKGARRDPVRKPENRRWEFDVGPKARSLCGDRLFYAFVDFDWCRSIPKIFIVPSSDVKAKFVDTSYPRNMFWLMDSDRGKYLERWDFISELMKTETAKTPASRTVQREEGSSQGNSPNCDAASLSR